MKEVKNKSSADTNVLQKHSQATEEQLRVAKLSQLNSKEDHHIQEKIKEVSDITMKPPDIVFVALHDCNYDTNLAIQNIFEGKYEEEQDEWKTTGTKKGRKLPGLSGSSNSSITPTTNHNNVSNNHNESLDAFDDSDEKPSNNKANHISRGGGMAAQRGRSSGRGKRGEDRFASEEKWDTVQDKGSRSNRSSDRGSRTRARGRGASRGGSRGGRGGFGRGGGGAMRGAGRSRGTGRGGSGGGGRRPRENRTREENGFGEPNDVVYSGGFGGPANDNDNNTESWDLEADTNTKTENWGDDIPENNVDWSKDTWGNEPTSNDSAGGGVNSLFQQNKVDWSQMNGNSEQVDKWEDEQQDTTGNNAGKYVPEQVDAAVICSIPTSATSAEVTSYQPTNDISRYINNSASNQFPSSQQEGGLTNSLNEREFSLSSNLNVPESALKNNMPMVSGITESHKLEQEQLRAPKPAPAPQQGVLPPGLPISGPVAQQPKTRKNPGKNVSLPSQPVVMPRSAQMVHDAGEQFAGLEFGSPVSPRGKHLPSTSASSNHTNDASDVSLKRQPVARIESPVAVISTSSHELLSQSPSLLSSSKQTPVTLSSQLESTKLTNDVITQKEVSQPLTAFKPLEQPERNSHFRGSPNRGLGHGIAAEPIPFPSCTSLSSPTSSSSLDVFARHSGLGTSVTMSKQQQQQTQQKQQQQQQQPLSSYRDKQVYDAHEQTVNAEKILAEQKALAEKQYLVEQQRVLAEQQREKAMSEQRAFAEQKALAQQKLLASQRSTEEINSRSESVTTSLQDSRKTLADQRLGLAEATSVPSAKEGSKITSTEGTYSTKSHRSTNPRSISSPPGLSSSVYTSNVSKNSELLHQAATTGPNNSKGPSKVSSAPPGMIHPNLLYTTGVQPGMVPTYQQLHGYNYDELLQLQRLQMSQSPYHYDVSTMYPPPNAAAAAAREGMPNYPPGDSKFQRGNEESTPGSLHQANPHVAASNLNPHQAYMNAGQLPYGFAYAFQPGVMPQAGIYPTFTAPNVFQLNQAKGVVGTQYQSQYAGQQGFNAGKYSGAGSHDFSKGNFHSSGSAQTTMSAGKGNQQHSMNSTSDATQSVQAGGQFKGQGYNDAKSFLATTPSSMTSQPTMAMHGQTAHIGNMNPYLLQQQQQQHTSLLAGPVSATQLGHQGSLDNRNAGHQVAFSGNQQKRDVSKGSYHSYWSGNR